MTMFMYEQPICMHANYQYTSQSQTVHYSVTKSKSSKTEVGELQAVIEGFTINQDNEEPVDIICGL